MGQGLKAWFTSALREGAREAERQGETGREREGVPLSWMGNRRGEGKSGEKRVRWG